LFSDPLGSRFALATAGMGPRLTRAALFAHDYAARMVRPTDRRRVCRRQQEDGMRKFLLASVATLGTGGLMGAAFAQAPTAVVGAPSQRQAAFPMANPTAYVNNNNNYQAPALPGPVANPTPGTIVHMNGKAQTTFQSSWTSSNSR
jgi:hypothetical protein